MKLVMVASAFNIRKYSDCPTWPMPTQNEQPATLHILILRCLLEEDRYGQKSSLKQLQMSI